MNARFDLLERRAKAGETGPRAAADIDRRFVIRLKKGHLGIEQPARLQHPAAFGYRLPRIFDVLKQPLKNDEVHSLIAKRQGERGSYYIGRPGIIDVYVYDVSAKSSGPCSDIQDRSLKAGPLYQRLDAPAGAPSDQKRLRRRCKQRTQRL
jgi:hypothetical protein